MVTKEQFFWGIVIVVGIIGRLDSTGFGLVVNFVFSLIAIGFFLYETFYIDRENADAG